MRLFPPSGKPFNVFDTTNKWENFPLRHVLDSLSNEYRFANQAPYTVLEHQIACILVANKMYPGEPKIQMFAGLHDMHEAIIRDIPSPFKRYVGEEFTKAEDHVQEAMFKSMSLPRVYSSTYALEATKEIDAAMAYVEVHKFFGEEFKELVKDEQHRSRLVWECVEAVQAVYSNRTKYIQFELGKRNKVSDYGFELFRDLITTTH